MADAGSQDVDGIVGDQDPYVAACEAWDPGRYDEVIGVDSAKRRVAAGRAPSAAAARAAIHARVTHVTSSPPRREVQTEPAPARERSPLGPLSALAWGHPRDDG